MTTARARIGRTIKESTPGYTPVVRAPEGAPNVVIILLDDLGFAQLGCFGSDIETPHIDGLAAGGLRYNRFHVTALCSPTRACLLTGRNHHAVGMGFLTDLPTAFPGYTGRIPRSAATLARVLRDNGFNTMAVGKWHLAPRWELSASGPFDRWPLGLGFERYYGFLGGDTNQWTPNLVADNHFVDPPRRPEEGYHLTEDLADTAIRMIQDQHQATPHKPFFLYFATGATHAPHQAPARWIERYRGRFDDGWDRWRDRTFARQLDLGIVPAGTVLTPRPSWVAAWASLPVEQQRLYARMQEVFAAFLSHTDEQIGRVLAFLDRIGVLDDTLVIVCSDNGTSAEGGPIGSVNEHRWVSLLGDDLADNLAHIDDLGGFRAYNHYAWGWAWAGNTPLRLWKRYAWLGGTRTPLVVHWPRRITDRGAVRSQFAHAIDLRPTILDVAGIAEPEQIDGVTQQPVDGASLAPTFDDPDAPEPRSTQYFEMLGSRALYHEGWRATTDHVSRGVPGEEELLEGSRDFETDRWALFHLDTDFSESTDVSEAHPEKLRQLQALWWAEAGRNQVLPIDDSLVTRLTALEPSPHPPRSRYVYRPGGGPVAEHVSPPLGGGFRLHARVEVPTAGAQGVICAQGDWVNGWALYALGGVLVWTVNLCGDVHRIVAETPLPPGRLLVWCRYERAPSGGGRVTLGAGDAVIGDGVLPRDLPYVWQIGGAGFRVGADGGFPVCDDYTVPFPWTGTIDEVVIEPTGFAPRDADVEMTAALLEE